MAGTGSKLSALIDDAELIDRLGESIPGLVYVYDLVERRNAYTNRALADQLGYTPAEVRAMGNEMVARIIHPEDAARTIAHHQEMSEAPDGAIVEIEYRVLSAAKEWRWLHSWDTVLTRDDGERPRLLLGVAQDVTARVGMEDALRDSEKRLAASEQRWRSIAENPFDFVVVIDRNYKFTYVNFGAPGVKPEDLIGKATPFDFVPEEYHAVMRAAYDEVFGRGRAASYEVYVPIAGQWLSSLVGPIREGEVVTHASILTREVTSEKQMAALVSRAERRFRLATEGAEEVLFDRDLETNEAFVAPKLYELLGFEADAGDVAAVDVFGDTFFTWVHPDDRAAARAALGETLNNGTAFSQEFRLRTTSGEYRWFSCRCRVMKEAGQHDHLAGFLADSTERRSREAELARKNAELEDALETRRALEAKLAQAGKLEAVGRLAGGIAHDFNNLLTGISGVADLLSMRLPPGDPMESDVADLQAAVQRGAGLTRQLLAFSRQQLVAPTVIDLNELLAEATSMLRRLIGENIDVRLQPASTPAPVRCDRSQLEQVILNLAVNARDAMPSGGRLFIELCDVDVDAVYCQQQPDALPGRFVRLAVTDTGCGMDAATLSRIFEPFFTTKPIGIGTGLGLATVYGVVRQSGGFIHVYSEPGHGTTFKLYFPAASAAPEEPQAAPEVSPRGSETILLVEDEELVQRLARGVLERLGYTVLTARRGDDALRLVEAGAAFDLLLTDVILPGLDGPNLYGRAKALKPELKVVFMSGYTDNLLEEKGLGAAKGRFLQKPFVPATLARLVRSALDDYTHAV